MEDEHSDNSPSDIYQFRVWELDENSTRHDKLVAAPSDEDLSVQWLAWTILSGVVATFASLLLFSILANQKNRREPYNLYLIYLIIPDVVFSGFCTITCALNFTNGEYWSAWMCKFQAVYVIFGIGSNAWLNAFVTKELHKMLISVKMGSSGQRYTPPSNRHITLQAIGVYLFALSLGIVTISNVLPYEERLLSGLACLPADYSHTSAVFFYAVFIPLLAFVPVGWVLYICYDVYKNDLLPETGKSRLNIFFFGRLIVVYLIFWIPSVIFIFILSPWTTQWVSWTSGAWSHLQGLASAMVSLTKPALFKGFRDFLLCRCNNQDYYTSSSEAQSKLTGSNNKDNKSGSNELQDMPNSSSRCSGQEDSQDKHSKKTSTYTLVSARRNSSTSLDGKKQQRPKSGMKRSSSRGSFGRIDYSGTLSESGKGSVQSLMSSTSSSILDDLTLHSLAEECDIENGERCEEEHEADLVNQLQLERGPARPYAITPEYDSLYEATKKLSDIQEASIEDSQRSISIQSSSTSSSQHGSFWKTSSQVPVRGTVTIQSQSSSASRSSEEESSFRRISSQAEGSAQSPASLPSQLFDAHSLADDTLQQNDVNSFWRNPLQEEATSMCSRSSIASTNSQQVSFWREGSLLSTQSFSSLPRLSQEESFWRKSSQAEEAAGSVQSQSSLPTDELRGSRLHKSSSGRGNSSQQESFWRTVLVAMSKMSMTKTYVYLVISSNMSQQVAKIAIVLGMIPAITRIAHNDKSVCIVKSISSCC